MLSHLLRDFSISFVLPEFGRGEAVKTVAPFFDLVT